jgi:hypothetical protein
MRRFLLQCVIGSVGVTGIVGAANLAIQPSAAWAAEAATAATKAQIERWIAELDADSYPARERATASLIAAGPQAIEQLAPGVSSKSAEVAWRTSIILQRIAVQGDEDCVNRVAAALYKVKVDRPAVNTIVRDIQTHQQKFRHRRAIAKIRSLGGQLTGRWQDGPQIDALLTADFTAVPVVEEADLVPDPVTARFASPVEPPGEEPAEEERPVAPALVEVIARLLPAVEAPAELPVELAPVEVAPAKVAELELAPAPPIAPIPAPVGPALEPASEPAREIVLTDTVPVAPVVEAVPATPAEVRPATLEVEDLPTLEPKAEIEAAAAKKVEFEAPAVAAAAPVVAEVEMGFVEVDFIEVGGGMVGPAVFIGGGFDPELAEGDDYAELAIDKSFQGTDADLKVLKDIPELYTLAITDAKLTDEALQHIAALPHLTSLTLKGTPFSPEALRDLRKQRPTLSVVCRSSAMLGINAGLEGACVLTSVFHKSGAEDAGLKAGDEVVEVNGQRVRDFSDLTIAVYPHGPGDKLAVKYRRAGKVETVDVTLKPRFEK